MRNELNGDLSPFTFSKKNKDRSEWFTLRKTQGYHRKLP